MAQRCDYCAVIPDFYPVIPDFHPLIRDFYPIIPDFHPVIPAKAGIQTVAIKPAIRNQAPSAAGGSPFPYPSRHSRESGNPQVGEQPSRPKPSVERERQIPSPFMGEG